MAEENNKKRDVEEEKASFAIVPPPKKSKHEIREEKKKDKIRKILVKLDKAIDPKWKELVDPLEYDGSFGLSDYDGGYYSVPNFRGKKWIRQMCSELCRAPTKFTKAKIQELAVEINDTLELVHNLELHTMPFLSEDDRFEKAVKEWAKQAWPSFQALIDYFRFDKTEVAKLRQHHDPDRFRAVMDIRSFNTDYVPLRLDMMELMYRVISGDPSESSPNNNLLYKVIDRHDDSVRQQKTQEREKHTLLEYCKVVLSILEARYKVVQPVYDEFSNHREIQELIQEPWSTRRVGGRDIMEATQPKEADPSQWDTKWVSLKTDINSLRYTNYRYGFAEGLLETLVAKDLSAYRSWLEHAAMKEFLQPDG